MIYSNVIKKALISFSRWIPDYVIAHSPYHKNILRDKQTEVSGLENRLRYTSSLVDEIERTYQRTFADVLTRRTTSLPVEIRQTINPALSRNLDELRGEYSAMMDRYIQVEMNLLKIMFDILKKQSKFGKTPIGLFGPNGQLVEATRSWRTVTSYQGETLEDFVSLIEPEQQQDLSQLTEEKTFTTNLMCDKPRQVNITMQPLLDNQDNPLGLVIYATRIEHNKAYRRPIKAARRQFIETWKTILNSLPKIEPNI